MNKITYKRLTLGIAVLVFNFIPQHVLAMDTEETETSQKPSHSRRHEKKVRSDWDEQDVILIQYKLPSDQRKKLVEGCLSGSLPQMKKNKSWHLTLLMVKNVKSPHRQPLKKRLKKLALSYHSSESFTPRNARYLQTEDDAPGVIALFPQIEEEELFKRINLALIEEVRKYENINGLSYEFHPYTQSDKYIPHLTVASTGFIERHQLNIEQVTNTINQKISPDQNDKGVDVVVINSGSAQGVLPGDVRSNLDAIGLSKRVERKPVLKEPDGSGANSKPRSNKAYRKNVVQANGEVLATQPKKPTPKAPQLNTTGPKAKQKTKAKYKDSKEQVKTQKATPKKQ
ncbi:MAG: hypothetical protein K2Y18_01085 [Alphaproteobacteria bacterium]|jgi:hypothetical protein|nr:hypothetical protein [Alphaproteobacteria bacterium]